MIMNKLFRCCLLAGLILLLTACPLLHLYDFVYFNNRTSDSFYLIMQFNPTDSAKSENHYFDGLTFGPGKYQLSLEPHVLWSDHIQDSVAVYLYSLDSLRNQYELLDLHPGLVQEDYLLARLMVDGDVFLSGERTLDFPPDDNAGIKVIYYNNYVPIAVEKPYPQQ